MDSTPSKPPRLRPRAPTTPPPPPPPAETVAAAAPEPEPTPAAPTQQSVFGRRFFRFGGQGLLASLAIHGVLLFLATAWVVSITTNQKKEPNTFTTGAGGGKGGERAIAQKTKAKTGRLGRGGIHGGSRTTISTPTLRKGNLNGGLNR